MAGKSHWRRPSAASGLIAVMFALLLCRLPGSVRAQQREPENASPPGFDLGSLFDRSGSIWQYSPDKLREVVPAAHFTLMAGAQDEISAVSTDPHLAFASIPIMETTARFISGELQEMILYVYNQGDAGNMNRKVFDNIVADSQKRLSDNLKTKPSPVITGNRPTGAVLESCSWAAPPYRVDLEWGYTRSRIVSGTRFPARTEYIRIRATPFDAANDPRRILSGSALKSDRADLSARQLTGHVARHKNGDVLINGIPMVDQGEKGYCVVATAERIFRYYAVDIDQHELAQLARTSAAGGTNPQIMLDVLRKTASTLGIQVREHYRLQERELERLIDRYDRAARRARIRGIDPEAINSLSDLYDQMNLPILKQVRLTPRSAFTRFIGDVREKIQAGIPLAWSVMLGKVAESERVLQTGPHMRLIIGYNDHDSEVIYSDSWGDRHALKRMDPGNAWTITLGLFTLEPR